MLSRPAPTPKFTAHTPPNLPVGTITGTPTTAPLSGKINSNPFFPDSGRIEIPAVGTLDKPLTVKADAFSLGAVKMITLTGGQAIELKEP